MIEELTIFWSLGSTCIYIHVYTPPLHRHTHCAHYTDAKKKQGRGEFWNHTLHHLFAQCSLHYKHLITQGFSVVRNHVFSGKELLMSVKTSPSKRALRNYSLAAQRQIWNLNIVYLPAIKTGDIFYVYF